jgi:CRISPR-associated protein Csx17
MQRLRELFTDGPEALTLTAQRCRAALFGDLGVTLSKLTVGQFNPQASALGLSERSRVDTVENPWSLVLLLEGALLYASGATRRLGSGDAIGALPFMVATSAVGNAVTAPSEASRGEVWTPVWRSAASLAELRSFMGEGRIGSARRQASGLDAAKAAAALAVDRGVDEFVRNGLIERNGLANLAVPLGRIDVRERPAVRLLAPVDHWVRAIRRAAHLSSPVDRVLRQLDDAQYVVATVGDHLSLQRLLDRVAALHERVRPRWTTVGDPRGLVADDWLPSLDDGSAEFALAASLASRRLNRGHTSGIVRFALGATATPAPPGWPGRDAQGLGRRPLPAVLAEAAAIQEVGLGTRIVDDGLWCRPDTVQMFVDRRLDDPLIEVHLRRLMLLNWAWSSWHPTTPATTRSVDPSTALLWPQVCRTSPVGEFAAVPTVAPPGWAPSLAAGRLSTVLGWARSRLRSHLLVPSLRDSSLAASQADGARLAIAFLVPVAPDMRVHLLRRATVPPPAEEAS